MTRSLLALFSAVTLFGCHFIDGGPDVSETRALEAFTRVQVEDAIPVKVSLGTPQVVINSQQKVVENLQTIVKDGQLTVRLKPGVIVESFDFTEILITSAGIDAVEANGASSLTATGLDASPLRVTASGASKVTVSGTTGDLRANASGASTIDALQLAATVASVEASGASKVELNVSQSVEGTASGASHVTVTGGASTTQISTSGGSTVSSATR